MSFSPKTKDLLIMDMMETERLLRILRDIAYNIGSETEHLQKLAEETERLNKLLNDVIVYPPDTNRPPYILIATACPVETIKY